MAGILLVVLPAADLVNGSPTDQRIFAMGDINHEILKKPLCSFVPL
jgi:hypothetical protein